MKLLLPLISLLIVAAATAQEEVLETPSHAAWRYLTIIASFEEVVEFLGQQGFSDEGIQALRDYEREGNAELKALSTRHVEDLCESGAEFENDPEKLAQQFEREEAAYEATRERLVGGLEDVLGAFDAAVFEWMLTHDVGVKMTGSTGIKVDVPGAVRAGTLKPADAVENACEAINRQ